MSRRRRRGNLFTFGLVLLAGIAVGAVALSIYLRTREPGSPPVGDPELRVEILNGCGLEGVAERVASVLRRGGYRVERVGNADHFHYRRDIVVARTVDLERAEELGRWLDGAAVVEQKIAAHPYDITVVVGRPHSLVSTP